MLGLSSLISTERKQARRLGETREISRPPRFDRAKRVEKSLAIFIKSIWFGCLMNFRIKNHFTKNPKSLPEPILIWSRGFSIVYLEQDREETRVGRLDFHLSPRFDRAKRVEKSLAIFIKSIWFGCLMNFRIKNHFTKNPKSLPEPILIWSRGFSTTVETRVVSFGLLLGRFIILFLNKF